MGSPPIVNALTPYDPRIQLEPNTGCWLWMQCLGRGGYGSVVIRGRTWRTHRAFWEQAHGRIPEGMVIDHICRVRSCCNPDHLRVVTRRVNALENSNSIPARFIKKDWCGRCGRPYDEMSVCGRWRVCGSCRRDNMRKYDQSDRAKQRKIALRDKRNERDRAARHAASRLQRGDSCRK